MQKQMKASETTAAASVVADSAARTVVLSLSLSLSFSLQGAINYSRPKRRTEIESKTACQPANQLATTITTHHKLSVKLAVRQTTAIRKQHTHRQRRKSVSTFGVLLAY